MCQAWIGLELPLQTAGPQAYFERGVLSPPRNLLALIWIHLTRRIPKVTGYIVNAETAVDLLALHHPEAANWWRSETPDLLKNGRFFGFDLAACEPVLQW